MSSFFIEDIVDAAVDGKAVIEFLAEGEVQRIIGIILSVKAVVIAELIPKDGTEAFFLMIIVEELQGRRVPGPIIEALSRRPIGGIEVVMGQLHGPAVIQAMPNSPSTPLMLALAILMYW